MTSLSYSKQTDSLHGHFLRCRILTLTEWINSNIIMSIVAKLNFGFNHLEIQTMFIFIVLNIYLLVLFIYLCFLTLLLHLYLLTSISCIIIISIIIVGSVLIINVMECFMTSRPQSSRSSSVCPLSNSRVPRTTKKSNSTSWPSSYYITFAILSFDGSTHKYIKHPLFFFVHIFYWSRCGTLSGFQAQDYYEHMQLSYACLTNSI